jgi:hypothetical protein
MIMVTPLSPWGNFDLGMRGRFMLQSSFITTPMAVICGGRVSLNPSRLAARPNLHGYGYLTLTQVAMTATCEPKPWDGWQVSGGRVPPEAGK